MSKQGGEGRTARGEGREGRRGRRHPFIHPTFHTHTHPDSQAQNDRDTNPIHTHNPKSWRDKRGAIGEGWKSAPSATSPTSPLARKEISRAPEQGKGGLGARSGQAPQSFGAPGPRRSPLSRPPGARQEIAGPPTSKGRPGTSKRAAPRSPTRPMPGPARPGPATHQGSARALRGETSQAPRVGPRLPARLVAAAPGPPGPI